LFNWDTSVQKIRTSLNYAGLNDKMHYYAFDFWANKPLQDIYSSIEEELPSESCKIIALRAKSNHPVVVSTSQHVTQGMIDLQKEEWKGETLSGTSSLIAGDPYEMRIAGMNDGGNWKLNKAAIVGNSNGISIEVLPQSEKGWTRVVIKSNESGKVKWNLKFTK